MFSSSVLQAMNSAQRNVRENLAGPVCVCVVDDCLPERASLFGFLPYPSLWEFLIWVMFSCLFLHKERESLREELRALKKENLLLKENNALANRKKEHYACEIKRLNKVADQGTVK